MVIPSVFTQQSINKGVIICYSSDYYFREVTIRGIEYLSREQAQYWKSREKGCLQILRGLADIMSYYETVLVWTPVS